jgi:hypothetical protein
VRSFLRSFPGWFAFQLFEFAALLAIAKILLALGLGGVPTFFVVMVLAVSLVVVNYNVRRRYLSDDAGGR